MKPNLTRAFIPNLTQAFLPNLTQALISSLTQAFSNFSYLDRKKSRKKLYTLPICTLDHFISVPTPPPLVFFFPTSLTRRYSCAWPLQTLEVSGILKDTWDTRFNVIVKRMRHDFFIFELFQGVQKIYQVLMKNSTFKKKN